MSPSSAATHSPAKVLNRSSAAEVGRAGAGAGAAAAAPAARTKAITTADRGTFTGISASPSPEAPHCASRPLVERRGRESTVTTEKSGIARAGPPWARAAHYHRDMSIETPAVPP